MKEKILLHDIPYDMHSQIKIAKYYSHFASVPLFQVSSKLS